MEGQQGRAGCWDSRFLATAGGCCSGEAGHGHGPSTLGPPFSCCFQKGEIDADIG